MGRRHARVDDEHRVHDRGAAGIGVPSDTLELFPSDFRQGMRARARKLGDLGDSDPNAGNRFGIRTTFIVS